MTGIRPAGFPLFRILIAFSTGISIGMTWFPIAYFTLLLVVLVLLMAILTLYLLFFHQSTFLSAWYIAPLCIYPLFIVLGIYLTLNADPRTGPGYFAGLHAQGLVISAEEPAYVHGRYLRFRAQVMEVTDLKGVPAHARGYLLMNIRDTTLNIAAGQRFLIPANYKEIPPPLNPASFDYQAFEAIHQVFHQCTLQVQDLHYLRGRDALNLTTLAFRIQELGARLLTAHIHGQGPASFLSAMVTGQRSGLPAMLYQSFSRTGTVHIISISGMHVQIVYTLLSLLVSRFKKSERLYLRIFRKVFLISFIWFYALISGFSPAVCRCALMIMLLICTEHRDYKVAGPLMLSLSAFLLLLVQPWLLADMGFQLSYLAVAGLYAFQAPIKGLLSFNHPLLKAFWNLSSTSIAAQIFTFPVCLWYFHQFPVYFLFANLVIIPLTGLMLYLGIALLALGWLPLIGALLSLFYENLYTGMSWILNFFSALPGSVIEGIYPGPFMLVLLSLFIFSFHSWLGIRNKTTLVQMLMLGGLMLMYNMVSQGMLLWQRKILFLAIRQSESICLIQGQQAYLCVPELPDKNLYDLVYKPALASLGVHGVCQAGVGFKQRDLQISRDQIRFKDWTIFLKGQPTAATPDLLPEKAHALIYTENNYILTTRELAGQHPGLVISGNTNSASSILKTSALCRALHIPCTSLRVQGGTLISVN